MTQPSSQAAVTIPADDPERDFTLARSDNANEALPLTVRMRAATEAAPYVHPKLSATAVFPAGEDFATRLERAIARSGGKLIEHRQADTAEG
jgi:hypothetical protein